MNRKISRTKNFNAHPRNLTIPGDKSISHRGVMFGAMSSGKTRVKNVLKSADVNSTRSCFEKMGAKISEEESDLVIEGLGLRGLQKPQVELDCGNSGTTMRLIMGVLAGQSFDSILIGDESLSARPMARVSNPLSEMGAEIGLTQEKFPPVRIHGTQLRGCHYELPMASAQVKSAILLAGLYADGETKVSGQITSRDHTERLLPHFGAELSITGESIAVRGGQELIGSDVDVPGDQSSLAFWLAAVGIVLGGSIEVENISLNPTRTGFLEVLKRMGLEIREEIQSSSPEPVGRLVARHSELRATSVESSEVASLVDEIPMLAVLATQARGETTISGAEELRVKETDRIEAVATNLRSMGAELEVKPDGFVIPGPQKLKGAKINSFHDHRIAMAFSIAGLCADGETEIEGAECVEISYPTFFESLEKVTQNGS